MADVISEEVKLIRSIIRNSETKFVVYSASERTSLLYAKNTGNVEAILSVNSDSLQSFKVGENKVKYLFKVE